MNDATAEAIVKYERNEGIGGTPGTERNHIPAGEIPRDTIEVRRCP